MDVEHGLILGIDKYFSQGRKGLRQREEHDGKADLAQGRAGEAVIKPRDGEMGDFSIIVHWQGDLLEWGGYSLRLAVCPGSCALLAQSEPGMFNALVFASVLMSAGPTPERSGSLFTLTEFAQLKFLAGRWKGTAPDGKDFYEEYDFPAADALRSRRYADATFSISTDSSTVSFDNGEVVSRWGEFSWRATQISADRACFAPVNAPSSFCWQRAGADVEVIQRWKGEDGKEQSYTLKLVRIDGGSV